MKDDEFYIVVDKSLCIWNDLESAINYYTHVYNVCKKRNDYYYPEFASIVLDLAQGETYSNPRYLKNCNIIKDFRGKNTCSYIDYSFSKRTDIFQAIKFWNDKIKKVLDICDYCNIDYNNRGFKESSNETIEQFYTCLFDKFDINTNSILFKNKNNSDFELIIDGSIKVNVNKTDKIMNVLNNIDYIKREIDTKKMKEEFEIN